MPLETLTNIIHFPDTPLQIFSIQNQVHPGPPKVLPPGESHGAGFYAILSSLKC